ncbi:MAG: PQQ-binding-like beta-propeller repeat protein [Planctomycetia bacterium]|nr:PQQ-binding-like beta-propeller repeat protein [Planctomycetia bacterium]
MKKLQARSFISLLLLSCITLSATLVTAADWPCWRGANRNGLSSETGLLRNWTEESSPQLVWKNTGVGQTMNGIAVLGNLVYTIGTKGGSECVFCIDNQTGKTLWSRPIGKKVGGKGKFPVQQSTPTIYKDKLYVVSSAGNLVCMNAGNGMPLWVRNMITTMGGVLPKGGYCESPYVDGKWVIVCPGGPNASMVAIDRHWAMNKWVAQTGMPAGYSSIVKASFGREHQYVYFSGAGLFGAKVKGGDVRWRYEAPAHESGYNACPPIWFGQTILASSAAGTGCVWIQKDGSTFKTSEVWFREDLKVPTGDMLKVNDNVFACTDEDGLLCFNYKTGDKIWSDKSLFAEAFEEEVDDSGNKSKKSRSRKTAMNLETDVERIFGMNTDLIPESIQITSPILAQDTSASESGNGPRTVEIKKAPKTKKKKAVPPPETPKCMGAMAYAEGLIYLRTSMGELVLFEASPDGFKARGRIKLPQMKAGLAVTPVIANGYLYLREGSTIFCFDLRDQSRKDGSDGSGSGDASGNDGKPLPGMPTAPGTKKRTAPKVG